MGMSLEFRPDLLELNIRQLGERAVKGMSDRMRKHAILIRDLARDYAPEKSGLLEENIDYSVIKDGRRNAYVVFINLDALRKNGKQGELGDYAFIMEEELHPHGRQKGERYYRLGPGSKAKAASGKRVGGRFLSRAVRDGTKSVMADVVDEVRRVMGGTSRAGVQYRRAATESEEWS